MTRPILCIALTAAALTAPSALRADLIRLSSGGEIRGRIERAAPAASRETVTIETMTGAVVVVERRHVQFVTSRPMAVEEYESRARRLPDTPEAHWELAEWCRLNHLRSQRESHLERLVELDPDHEAARRALGHVLHDGEWTTHDELMQSQGYVKHRGRYITPQELEILEKSQAELDAEREWYPKVRLWMIWLNGRNEERQQTALAELQAITDPHAVPALARNMRDDSNRQVRLLYVGILANVPGEKPVPPLVAQSLQDADAEVRYLALHGLSPEQRAMARPLYLAELGNANNLIVRRTGTALQTVGDETIVPQLIEALTTTHRYRVRVADPTSSLALGFPPSRTATGGAGIVALPPELRALLNSGQLPYGAVVNFPQGTGPQRTRIVTVRHEHRNAEVLTALQKLTGESFGYDKRSWRMWLASAKQGTE